MCLDGLIFCLPVYGSVLGLSKLGNYIRPNVHNSILKKKLNKIQHEYRRTLRLPNVVLTFQNDIQTHFKMAAIKLKNYTIFIKFSE